MLSTSSVKIESKKRSVESAAEQIKAMLGDFDCLVLVGTAEPEVSAVLDDGEEVYREVVPLGDGVHIVITLDLPTELAAGIHEL